MSNSEHFYPMPSTTRQNYTHTPIHNGSRISKRKNARKNRPFDFFRFGGTPNDPLNLNGLIQNKSETTSNSVADDNLANKHGKDRPVEILLQPYIFDPLRLDPSSHNDEDINNVCSVPSNSTDSYNHQSSSTVQSSRTKRNLRKRRHIPPPRYGNYHGYYGYRKPEQDQRFQYFQNDWFHDKQVLDIGCHSGHVTFHVAEHFQPRRIVGLDIDPHLIQRGQQQLSSRMEMNNDPANRFPFNLQFQQNY